MLSFFRRVSKSKIGTWVVAAIGVAILAGFALADLSNFGTGNVGFGMNSGTLAKVGDQQVSEREVSSAMQRHLQDIRQQQPDADYRTIIGDFSTIIDALLEQRTLMAFADKYGFPLSKPLVDAEIAQLPGTKGLNGQFSDQAYQQFLQREHLTDAEVRQILAGGLLQRLLLTPVATAARIPVGMATPYASMLLEAREGQAALIPLEPFKAGLQPTDAQLREFWSANRARYIIPEQRVLRIARIGPEQVANVTASDAEITAYYNANKAIYAPSDMRSITQVVVQDQSTANAIAQRAKGGQALAAAAAPAGGNAAVTTLKDQTREAYAGVAGEKVATAVFGAAGGSVVGPLRSDFGWVVVKVDSVKAGGGKSMAQARTEIAAKLTADKRKSAIEDLDAKVEDAIAGGGNFTEAAAAGKLSVTTTPLIAASGTSRSDPNFHLAPELAPALKSGFDIAPSDQPDVVALPGDAGYAVVSPAQVVPAAPAPLASIRDQVATDWINDQATQRARAAATQIAAKAEGGLSLADAMKGVGVALPAPQPVAARRIQIANARAPVPPALKTLFSIGGGKSRMGANPQGGFFVIKVNKITPGNALLAPGLISSMQNELGGAASQDYAEQFISDLKREMKAKKNNSAIEAFRARLLSSGG